MLLAGLRFSVCSSGFLTASCVLLGVTVVSLCGAAVFPIDRKGPRMIYEMRTYDLKPRTQPGMCAISGRA